MLQLTQEPLYAYSKRVEGIVEAYQTKIKIKLMNISLTNIKKKLLMTNEMHSERKYSLNVQRTKTRFKYRERGCLATG